MNLSITFADREFTLESGMISYEGVALREELTMFTCVYNGKRRYGLDLGDDTRTADNLTVLTTDGLRTFTKTKIEDRLDLMQVKTMANLDSVNPRFK